MAKMLENASAMLPVKHEDRTSIFRPNNLSLEWGNNCGSESSTLETDVCVWRYAPLVVHATQEEEEEDVEW